jgi:ubiquinol-cytochrome c reductase cytochrome b/c1 subunit
MNNFFKNNKLVNLVYKTFGNYPTPINLTYMWNFGVYAVLSLLIQIISGVFLGMYYSSDPAYAFASVDYIMREVPFGWLVRYIHANGASFFFFVVYIHLFRGVYYGSFLFPRVNLWISGLIMFILMIITAFLGYVLPWGQMSFWAATVITNLLTAIPLIGTDITYWLWGGYSVETASLRRFYSLHFFLPFFILGTVFFHISFLHDKGSNNPTGFSFRIFDKTSMFPYYIYKDILGLVVFFVVFILFIYFVPNLLGHTDNYILSDSMVTPAHIVPEWYFLPFYAILRSIPDKLLGVICMILSLFVLFLLPFITKNETKVFLFKPLARFFFWSFVITSIFLGYIGSQPAEAPYVQIGQFLTFYYFFYFFIIIPFIYYFETFFWKLKFFIKNLFKKK